MNLHATPTPGPASLTPGDDRSVPSERGSSLPRESGIVGRYLPDPSLRYTRATFAGPSTSRLVFLSVAMLLGIACIALPLVYFAFDRALSIHLVAVVPGILLSLPLMAPLRAAWNEFRHKLPFWWAVQAIDVGLERAVPQPGTSLRYEVHFVARRPIALRGVQVRLVFWESWMARARLKWLRVPFWRTEKTGHDLFRQQVDDLVVARGEHAVVRGAIPVPLHRPSEHHRGKTKHLSYINITVTLSAGQPGGPETHRGNCPHLITFPWI